MATDQRTIDYILDQLSAIEGVTARKMFGEYGLFYEGKTVALVCDDQLFVKLTDPGRVMAAGAREVPPYQGAKPALQIDAERWEDTDWLADLIRTTAKALPLPKPKRQPKR